MPTMTKSLEDYIETIYVLIKEKGAARVRDVAADLHVKMPSVVKAMAELKKLELVIQEPYGDIELTAKGRKVATGVLTRHTILKAFLLKLGVTEKTADNDACLMEHILSAQTMDRIRDFLGKTSASPDKPMTTKKAKTKKETK
ncbi:MAG: metal-dependent transcriptional regulator [Kiritimatiellae bacterium]|nr:metal-dependent transcriptional regulator [Kiritimatiellia bacterium]